MSLGATPSAGCSCEIISGLPFWQLASSSCGTTHAEHPLPQRNGLTATVSKLFTLSKLLTRLEFYRFCFTATCRQPRCAVRAAHKAGQAEDESKETDEQTRTYDASRICGSPAPRRPAL